jgi:hypothetical protein
MGSAVSTSDKSKSVKKNVASVSGNDVVAEEEARLPSEASKNSSKVTQESKVSSAKDVETLVENDLDVDNSEDAWATMSQNFLNSEWFDFFFFFLLLYRVF